MLVGLYIQVIQFSTKQNTKLVPDSNTLHEEYSLGKQSEDVKK